MAEFPSVADVLAARGQHLGYTKWDLTDQDRIQRFPEATGDHNWIHVDAERTATSH